MKNSIELPEFDQTGKAEDKMEKIDTIEFSQEENFPLSVKQADTFEAQRINAIREDLVKGSKSFTESRKDIKDWPKSSRADSVDLSKAGGKGFKNLLRRYMSVGLAALGLAGGSKLDAQTNEVDKAAIKGSGTNITEVAKAEADAEQPFVYGEQKNVDQWPTTTPETKAAAMERLQKKSAGGGSVFNVPDSQKYTPPASVQKPENLRNQKLKPVQNSVGNRVISTGNENRGYRHPLIQINTRDPAPRQGEALIFNPVTGKKEVVRDFSR